MFAYLLETAGRNSRSRPFLVLLTVLAIGLGIGFLMTIVTVGYSMGKNPFPDKTDILYAVQVDAGNPDSVPEDPDNIDRQLTYLDSTALMRANQARRQFASAMSYVVVVPDDPNIRTFQASARATFTDFFPMLDVPFEFGSAWAAEADENAEQVVVLSHAINDRLFGGIDSVGQTVSFGDYQYVVVGVLQPWRPVPRVYDMNGGSPFQPIRDVFIPFNTMVEKEYERRGSVSCWKPLPTQDYAGFLASECTWIQFWVELHGQAERQAYLDFLSNYVTEQKSLGRFGRPINNHLRDIEEWLEYNQVVDEGVIVLAVIASLFLGVCLINALALLLAKFLARTKDIAIRRALGASKFTLFVQHLAEAGLVGAIGGVAGIIFAWLGLIGIRILFEDPDIVYLTSLDLNMLVTSIAIAVAATILTGIYPAWRASSIQPATYLKT